MDNLIGGGVDKNDYDTIYVFYEKPKGLSLGDSEGIININGIGHYKYLVDGNTDFSKVHIDDMYINQSYGEYKWNEYIRICGAKYMFENEKQKVDDFYKLNPHISGFSDDYYNEIKNKINKNELNTKKIGINIKKIGSKCSDNCTYLDSTRRRYEHNIIKYAESTFLFYYKSSEIVSGVNITPILITDSSYLKLFDSKGNYKNKHPPNSIVDKIPKIEYLYMDLVLKDPKHIKKGYLKKIIDYINNSYRCNILLNVDTANNIDLDDKLITIYDKLGFNRCCNTKILNRYNNYYMMRPFQ